MSEGSVRRGLWCRVLATVTILATLAVGCGTDGIEESEQDAQVGVAPDSTAESEDASPSDSPNAFPMTITDCGGRETIFEESPQRIVTYEEWTTEQLLWLGLGDRIVGAGQFSEDGRYPEELQDEVASLNSIANIGGLPALEAVVALEPDIIVSMFESAFTGTLPSREEWADMDVATHQTLSECDSDVNIVEDLSVFYHDLRTLGALFEVPERAEELIANLEATVVEVQEKVQGVEPVRVMTYGAAETLFVAGGSGIPNALINLAGGVNVFGEVEKDYEEVSFEEAVARDPEVLWILGSDPEAEIQRALDDARLAGISAIENERFVAVPHRIGGTGNIRNAEALLALFEAFHPDLAD